ncbi:MAG TPA: type III pantothenate kinase [Oscillatoriaceae cyanobacterium]
MNETKTITQALPADKEADQPLLVANLGNTHLRLVCFEGETRLFDVRVPSEAAAEAALPDLPAAAAIVLVSVVPEVAARLRARWAGHELYAPSAADFSNVRYAPPESLGPDRLVNALYLRERGAGVVIDAGTATTLTVVDGAGAIVGGAIMPGLGTAAASLHAHTALLPEVVPDVVATPWGTSTREALQLGLLEGHVGAILHLLARMEAALPESRVLLTGGWSAALASRLPSRVERVPDLTIEGARLAWRAHCR